MNKILMAFVVLTTIPLTAGEIKEPTMEDILYAVIANHNIPLSVHSSCPSALIKQGPGKETVGNYFAQLMAAMGGDFNNQFEGLKMGISKRLIKENKAGDPVWECKIMFDRQNNKSPWTYGILFLMNKNNKVIPNSFKCPGAP